MYFLHVCGVLPFIDHMEIRPDGLWLFKYAFGLKLSTKARMVSQ